MTNTGAWPQAITTESRPWTRWWWLGSALDKTEITRHLELFRDAGMGGVEVSPIYGAKGYEARAVPFLSPRWIALLAHTLREATRLELGVDLLAGTGWPYGGPWVNDADAARRLVWEDSPDTNDLSIAPTGQQVKRAAPGGEGNVLNHFSAEATRRYLQAFDAPLAGLPDGAMVRCFFNDSYEVFGANATPSLLPEFARRRGYDLRPHLRALKGEGEPETVVRVRADYRETMGDLVRDGFVQTWCAWARAKGARTRNQAHGSPGNLLDLYALADIPETEVFGPPRLRLSGLSALRPAPPDWDEEEELLVSKMASSAAHVAGRPLCSSESFTWAGEHGCVPLEHLKTEVDALFALGVNHLFFHGTPFSPADVPWPGWLFYATTHCAPTNPWWQDLAALNAYIARCQSFLQTGAPDNDVLVYFPFHDLLASDSGAHHGLQFLTVGQTARWLKGSVPAFVQAARALGKGGWGFDFVSDRQLAADVNANGIGLAARGGGARWRALLVAGCRLMPPETLERIAALAAEGATVLFLDNLPADVPGLTDLDARRARLASARRDLGSARRVFKGSDLGDLLTQAGAAREVFADAGLEWVRRQTGESDYTYFVSNPTTTDFAKTVPLAVPAGSAALLDPMTGAVGAAESHFDPSSRLEVRLSLPAGASVLLRTSFTATQDAPAAWDYRVPAASNAVLLGGAWEVAFVEGGPDLPAPRRVAALGDWTTWPGLDAADADLLRAFSGTARYTQTFDAPNNADGDGWVLDLGTVCHSARVRLNHQDLGTVLARPWRVVLPDGLVRATGNVLEIEATNLMANRLADREKREGNAWRPFLMVNIRYKPFNAAAWEPLPSGLVGPVTLAPLKKGTQATQ